MVLGMGPDRVASTHTAGSSQKQIHCVKAVFRAEDTTTCLYLRNKKAVFAWECQQTIAFAVYRVKQAGGAEQDSNTF